MLSKNSIIFFTAYAICLITQTSEILARSGPCSRYLSALLAYQNDLIATGNAYENIASQSKTEQLRVVSAPTDLARLTEILASPAPAGLIKLEIGANTYPLCDDCVVVDISEDVKVLYRKGFARELPIGLSQNPGFSKFLKQTNASFDPHEKIIGIPFELADARNLHFVKANSVNLIVSKNFVWFGGNQKRIIRTVLIEYTRVLSPNGKILLLTGVNEDPDINFKEHIEIAEDLGFKIERMKGAVDEVDWSSRQPDSNAYYFNGVGLSGILLTRKTKN